MIFLRFLIKTFLVEILLHSAQLQFRAFSINENCLLKSSDGGCIVCGENFYKKNFFFSENELWQDYSAIEFLPCLEKNSSILKRNVLISSASIITCSNCPDQSNYDKIYFDIGEALISESQLASQHLKGEISIFLFGKEPHIFMLDEAMEGIQFFRGSNISINIDRWDCSTLLKENGKDLFCLNNATIQKAIIWCKTSAFEIYVTNTFKFYNVELIGSDLILKELSKTKTIDCIKLKKICCPSEPDASRAAECGLTLNPDLLERIFSWSNPSLFVLEGFPLGSDTSAPVLILENITLENMSYSYISGGFHSLIKIQSIQGSSVLLANVYLMNSHFMDGALKLNSIYNDFYNLDLGLMTVDYFLSPTRKPANHIISVNDLRLSAYKSQLVKTLNTTASLTNHFNFFKIKSTKIYLYITGLSLSEYPFNYFPVSHMLIIIEGCAGEFVFQFIQLENTVLAQLLLAKSIDSPIYLNTILLQETQFSNINPIEVTDSMSLVITNFQSTNIILEQSIYLLFFLGIDKIQLSSLIFIFTAYTNFYFKECPSFSLERSQFNSILSNRYFIYAEKCLINLYKITLDSVSAQSNIFFFLKTNYFFREINGTAFDADTAINAQNLEIHFIGECNFSKMTKLQYFWSPGSVFRYFFINESIFKLGQFQILLSAYVPNEFVKFLIITNTKFLDISISQIMLELCCVNFLWMNCLIDSVYIDPNTGRAVAVFETNYNYALSGIVFKNSGVPSSIINKFLSQSFFHSYIFLFFPFSVILVNITVINEKPDITLPSGCITSGNDVEYIFIYRLVIDIHPDNQNFKGITLVFTKMVWIIHSAFRFIECPKEKITQYHDTGAIGIFNFPHFGGDRLNNNTLVIINTIFSDCKCNLGGSLAIVNYNKIFIANCVFDRSSAQEAGVIFIIANQDFYCFQSQFTNASVVKSASFFSFFQLDNSYFINNSVIGGSSLENAAIYLCRIGMFYVSTFEGKYLYSLLDGGLFFLEETTLCLFNSRISNVVSSGFGGVIYSQSMCSISMKNNYFDWTSALNGALIMAEDTSIIELEDLRVSNCSSEHKSSVIDASSYFRFSIKSVVISQCLTLAKGVISLRSSILNQSTTFINTIFYQNTAYQGAMIYFESGSHLSIQQVSISNCNGFNLIDVPVRTQINIVMITVNFNHNYAGSLLLFSLSSVLIRGALISNNILLMNAITILHSIAEVQFIYITDNNYPLSKPPTTSSIYLIYFSEGSLLLENIVYISNKAFPIFNGLVRCQLNCNFSMENLTASIQFFKSEPLIEITEGWVYLINLIISSLSPKILKLSEMEATVIQNLTLYQLTDEDISDNTLLEVFYSTQLTLKGIVLFLSPKTSILLAILSHIILENVLLYKQSPQSAIYNSSLSIIGPSNIDIDKFHCLFGQAKQGSCLYIKTLEQAFLKLTIVNSIFINNNAELGGVIFILARSAIVFLSSNWFFKNQAFQIDSLLDDLFDGGAGGVMFMSCINKTNCTIYANTNIFLLNFASNHGPNLYSEGVIFQEEEKPNNIYYLNSDGTNFTNKSSSLPLCLRVKSYGSASNAVTVTCGEVMIEFYIKSGMAFNLTIELIDKQSQILVYHNSTTAYMKTRDREVVLSQKESISNKGIISFYDITVKQKPNSNSSASLYLKYYNELTRETHLEYPISFKCNPCLNGEILQVDLKCTRCLPGTFYKIPSGEVDANARCEKCLNDFECLGGEFIFPKQGYWRFYKDSDLALKCITVDACTSFINEGKIEEQPCAEGNEGILCHQCSFGFGKLRKNTLCVPCDQDRPLYILRVAIFSVLLLVYVITNTLIFTESIKHKTDSLSPFIVLKILLNHLQLLSVICFTEDVSKLPLFQNLAVVQYYISFINEDIVSTECILQKYYQSQYSHFHKVLMTLLLPLSLGILALIFWVLLVFIYILLKTKKKSLSRTVRKVLVGFTICSYILYPMMIQKIFSLTNCMTLLESRDDPQNNSYLYESPNVKCWTPSYMKYFYGLFLPSVFIWGFIFPAALFRTLRRNWRKITHLEASLKDLSENPLLNNNYGNEEISVKRRNNVIGSNKALVMKIRRPQKYKLERILRDSQVFRFFYEDYKPNRFYWEIVIFMKKFVITMFVSSTQVISPDLNFLLQVLALVLYSVLVLRLAPFNIEKCNHYEFSSSILSFLTKLLIIVIGFQTSGSVLALIFSIFILVLNIIWILSILVLFSRLFIESRRQKKQAHNSSGSLKSSINILKASFVQNKRSFEESTSYFLETKNKSSIELFQN